MKKITFSLLVMALCKTSPAQNLIVNGGFETHTGCPSTYGLVPNCTNWTNPSSITTPDFFHACGSNNWTVPQNTQGNQTAHGGDGYIGLIAYYAVEWQEYAQVSLPAPLQADSCYHFEMYVSLGDNSMYATDELSAYFSPTSISGFSPAGPLPYTPQINNSIGFINDFNNWMLYTGDFVAAGGEQYIIIGNFKTFTATNITPSGTGGMNQSFIYIDDVSLTLNVCTGINELSQAGSTAIFPMPFKNQLSISAHNNTPVELTIYNCNSQKIMEHTFSGNTQLNTDFLSKGMYFYVLRDKKGIVNKGKIIKE